MGGVGGGESHLGGGASGSPNPVGQTVTLANLQSIGQTTPFSTIQGAYGSHAPRHRGHCRQNFVWPINYPTQTANRKHGGTLPTHPKRMTLPINNCLGDRSGGGGKNTTPTRWRRSFRRSAITAVGRPTQCVPRGGSAPAVHITGTPWPPTAPPPTRATPNQVQTPWQVVTWQACPQTANSTKKIPTGGRDKWDGDGPPGSGGSGNKIDHLDSFFFSTVEFDGHA